MIVAADTTDQAVQSALNVAYLLAGVVVGVLSGIVLAFVISLLLRAALGRTRLVAALLRRTRGPSYWALMSWGALIGFNVALGAALQGADPTTISHAGWVSLAHDLVIILAIAATTWVLYAAVWVVEDAARIRHAADGGVSRRFETQAQVLRRLLQALVVLVGLATAVLVTFPAARTAMSTLLASAGVVSVIAGLAAQSTLGNVFAGIQLAFTDAIRVGDVVVVGPNQDSGAIEEITLTYVVVRVWDERRLIMPSTEFASKPFENWTRRAARQLGTVELTLDWSAPMAQIRERVEHLLLSTDLWDGRTWSVQMTASDANSITVRVLVSAKDSGTLWDLRCYLRENLVSWIATDEAWARPVARYQRQEEVTVTRDTSREVVARLATELSGIAGPDTTAGGGSAQTAAHEEPNPDAQQTSHSVDAFHAARIQAARRKAKRARRHALAVRQREAAGKETPPRSDAHDTGGPGAPRVSESERTRVFSPQELQEITRRYDESTAARLAREAPSFPPAGHSDPGVPTPARPSAAGATPGGHHVAAGLPPATTSASTPDPHRPAAAPAQGPTAVGEVGSQAPTEHIEAVPATATSHTAPAGETPAETPAASPSSGPHSDTGASEEAPSAPAPTQTPVQVGKGERLYSGSPDAEERSAIFSGPGEDVLAEREQTALMRAVRSGSALTGAAAPPTGEGAQVVAKASVDEGDTGARAPAPGQPGPDAGSSSTPLTGAEDGVPVDAAGAEPRKVRVATDDDALDATRVMPVIDAKTPPPKP
ncbi:MAG: mechanosensitive ion channel [Propionibacterium sp.]|nr:mechanosensitive ion channel [Propionibacterium sp.]